LPGRNIVSAEKPRAAQEANPTSSLPIEDLKASVVDSDVSEEVRGGAGSTGKVHHADIPVVKPIDVASP
jgi:hypothetical protein